MTNASTVDQKQAVALSHTELKSPRVWTSWAHTVAIVAGMVAIPFSAWIRLDAKDTSQAAIKVPLFDVVLGICLLSWLFCFAIANSRRRGRDIRSWSKGIKAVPPEAVLLLIAAVLSLSIDSWQQQIKDVIQVFNYYLIWFALLGWMKNSLQVEQRVRWALLALLGGMISVAGWQIYRGDSLYSVNSFFSDRSSFLVSFVLLIPHGWAGLMTIPRKRLRSLAPIMVGCSSVLTASTLVACGALLCFSFLIWISRQPWKWAVLLLWSAAAMTLLSLPSKQIDELKGQLRSWIDVPLVERRSEVRQARESVQPEPSEQPLEPGQRHAFIQWSRNIGTGALTETSSHGSLSEELRVIPEYFPETWSALRLFEERPAFGWGIGNWQDVIGTRFGELERTSTSFPNQNNGWLMICVSMGAVGLASWIWLCASKLRQGLNALTSSPTETRRVLAIGGVASMVGSLLVLFYCPFVFQPIAGYWVLSAGLHAQPLPMNPSHDRAQDTQLA